MINTKIICTDGKVIYRKSRWIKRRTNYNPNKRNSLYYYATDGNGYRDGQTGFNPQTGLYLDYLELVAVPYLFQQ